MPSKAATAALAALIAAALLIGLIALWPAAAGAQAVTTGPVCGLSQRADQQADGTPVISRANAFDADGQRFCIKPAPHGDPGFTVLNNLSYDGQYQAYPFTGWGCAYDLCTAGARPIRLSKLPRAANTSFSWRPNGATGDYNASFDIWIGKTSQITTEDNGAELMVWERANTSCSGDLPASNRTPPRGVCQYARIGHRTYLWQWWKHCDTAGICWNYIQYRTLTTVRGLKQMWLRPFLTYLEVRGLILPWWWLTSIHAGFELVSGGKGLQVSWFNSHV